MIKLTNLLGGGKRLVKSIAYTKILLIVFTLIKRFDYELKLNKWRVDDYE
jgi:hypothetical protein